MENLTKTFLIVGGFPMEIKTKIRYLMICSYHFLPYKIMTTTNYKISHFSFNFDRKSTFHSSYPSVPRAGRTHSKITIVLFLKTYVMASTDINLFVVAHVKVDFILLQKINVMPMFVRFA